MAIDFMILDPAWVDLGTSYTVDFFLAFVLFTAISFAVLGRKLDHHRAAAAASAAVGTALAIGLVAWEVRSGWRVSDLGPVAAGFAMIVIAVVIHQALRKLGGDWAGAAVALGSTMLIGLVLELPWPVARSSIGVLGSLFLIIGVGMWLVHHARMGGEGESGSPFGRFMTTQQGALKEARATQRRVHDLDDVHRAERQVERSLDAADQSTRRSDLPAEQLERVRRRLAELIPAEGHVTQRLAELRARAIHAQKGQLARLRDLTGQIPKMTPGESRRGAEHVKAAYREIGFYRRIQRLDSAAAEVEKRVIRLTAQAETLARLEQIEPLNRLIRDAQRLQKQADKLLTTIQRDEKKLLALVVREVQRSRGDATSSGR